MAILSTRAVAATIARLITLIRKAIGDRNADRWSNADIRDFMDPVFAWMHSKMQSAQPMAHTTDIEVSYTASAQLTALPTGMEGNQIYSVEDITDPDHPIFKEWIEPVEIDKHGTRTGWSLRNGQIALRPVPSDARTLRVKVLANWFTVAAVTDESSASDQHAYPVNFEELIWLRPALTMKAIDGDPITQYEQVRLAQLEADFLAFADKSRNQKYIPNTRSFR